MKKFISMFIGICALAMFSVSAFAEGGIIGSSYSQVLDESGKYWIVEEKYEDGTVRTYTETYSEEAEESDDSDEFDDQLQVCPKCGKIHDGCCEEEAVRKHFEHYVDEDYGYLKFCELKDNALYFVTPENKLMLMNLKTKQLYFIADEVAGLSHMGMNGRYIAYVTLKGELFSVPYEVGEDGKLSTDFQMKFGE